MNDGDCLESVTSWNQFITYVQHSSCTDLTIYSSCTSSGQAFRFTQAGTTSKSYGGLNTGDDRQWIVNDTDTYPYIEGLGGSHLKFYTGNDIYFYDNAVEEFRFYDNSVDIKGDRAIYVNDDETYIGHGAGDNIGAGTNNTLVGHDAGQANSFSSCALFGFEAGKNNTQDSIAAIGYRALLNNTGIKNTALGWSALTACLAGTRNTGIGYNALVAVTSGDRNVAIGSSALELCVSGNYNTAIGTGTGAGAHGLANSCIYLGYEAGFNSNVHSRLYINSNNSAFPLIYGEFDNDIVKIGNNSDDFGLIFDVNTAGVGKIYGGDDTGDDLLLQANTTNTYSSIKLNGDVGIDISVKDANGIDFYRNNVATGFIINNVSSFVVGTYDNKDFYIMPHGTGVVSFGTYTATPATDSTGYITIKDAGGTTRKLMVQA